MSEMGFKAMGIFIEIMYVVFRILTFPIYLINKRDFNKKKKANPLYKSIFVRISAEQPWFYELSMYILNFPYPTSVYKILPPLEGEVLQIGCGTGLLNKYMRNSANIKFTNLDLNRKYLDYGVKKGRYEKYLCQDICKMEESDNKYDYIIFARCFHHIKNHKEAFYHCSKLLKDEGEIIVVDPVVLERRSDSRKLGEGYRVNSSIDGVIWRFSDRTLEQYISKKLPEDLNIVESVFSRLPHMTNYNLKYPQADARIIIKKRTGEEK